MFKYFRFALIISFCLYTSLSFSQKTQIYLNPDQYYADGIELYEKQMYGPAITHFENYKKYGNDPVKQNNSDVYAAISHLKLNHNGAEESLNQLINDKPEVSVNNLAFFELGNAYFDKGKFKKAAKYYDKAKVGNLSGEQFYEINFKMGYSYYKANEFDKAKSHFDNIRNTQNEYYVRGNYYYGYICYLQSQFDCALKSFEKIKDEGPKTMQLYIAQIYYAKGDYQKAISYADNIKIDKTANEINFLKGKCYFQLKNYAQAEAFFSKVDLNSLKPTDEEIYQIGYSAFEAQNYTSAKTYLSKISSSDNALGQIAGFQLGKAYLKTDMKENAFNAFADAKRPDFNKEIKETAHFFYAKLAVELGKQSIALKTTQEFIQSYPRSEYNDDAKGLLAELFLQTKNYRQACEVLGEIKNYTPQAKAAYQSVHFHRAEELYLDKDYTQAADFFTKSLKFVSDENLESMANFWLGELAFKDGKYTNSINYSNKYIAGIGNTKDKYYTSALYTIGYSYYLDKNYAQALNYFKKFKDEESYVTATAERYIDNNLRLADCYFIVGQYEKAAESYGFTSSKRVKGSDYATFQQGIIFGLLDKVDLKIATLRNIPQIYNNSIYVDDALYEIGNEYLEQEKFDLAESFFTKVINEHSSSNFVADALLKLGLVNFNQKQEDKAIENYKDVIKRFPKTKQSEEALNQLEIIYVQSGRGDEYLNMIKNLPGANIRMTYQDSLLYESAMSSYREGNCPKAITGFNNYLSKFGVNGFFYIPANFNKAECEFKNKNNDEALKHYKIVAEASKTEFSEKSATRCARLYYFKKDYTNAFPYYEKMKAYATTKEIGVESTLGLMRCAFQLKNYTSSKQYAIEMLTLQGVPKDVLVETNMILGRIHLMEKNYRTAEYHFNYVIKENKTAMGAEAMFSKADICFYFNKLDSCKNIVFTLSEDYASYDYWVAKGFILLSDVYVAKKDLNQAKATIESVIDAYEGEDLLVIARQKLKTIQDLIAANKAKQNLVPEE